VRHHRAWQRHYRGAFSDAFLDGEVAGFLLDTWTTRLAAPDPLARTDDARAFYEARGGTFVESRDVRPPADDPARLNGRPKGLRYAWPDPARLLKTDSDSEALRRSGARLQARP
jgi:hypothetical protein